MFTDIGRGHLAALAGVVLLAVGLVWALSGGDGEDGEVKVRTEAVKVKAKPFEGLSAVGRGTKAERERAARMADGEYVPEPGSQEEKAFKSTTKTFKHMGEATKVWTVGRLSMDVRTALAHTGHDPAFEEVCKLLSESARKETVEYARDTARLADVNWNCEKAVSILVRRANVAETANEVRKAEVVGMNVEGDAATATIKFGDQPLSSVSLVKENGEWKIGELPSESD